MAEGVRGSSAAGGARTVLAVVAGALLLAWPAFYNGYPLVYDDSASYLDTVDPRASSWARPVFYTWFLRPLHLHLSLWPPVFAQSLILAHLVHVAVRVLYGRAANGAYLLTMAALALTMLPWLTAMIMPHAFAGAVVLALFLLGFAADRLGRIERWYLALLAAGAITVHMSHLGLAIGLALVILALARPPRARAALLAAPVAAAMLAQLAVNSYARGAPSFAPATPIFLLARFVADGPAVDYLRAACPQRRYVLCAHLDRLPQHADIFLWDPDGVFRSAGGAAALHAEARAIVLGTVRAYPLRLATQAMRDALRQLVTLRIDSIMPAANPGALPDYPLRLYIEGLFPREYPAYLAARQSAGLPLRTINALHGAVTVLSAFAALFLAFAFRRRGDATMSAFPVVLLAAWIGNAAITATVSGVFGHYQGRLAWLVTLYAAIGLLRLAREVRLRHHTALGRPSPG
jgi:hypothetical protein